MGQLDGKAAIVTGSSRGIGRAVAMTLAAEGAAVVVNGREILLAWRDPDAGPWPVDELAEKVRAGLARS